MDQFQNPKIASMFARIQTCGPLKRNVTVWGTVNFTNVFIGFFDFGMRFLCAEGVTFRSGVY